MVLTWYNSVISATNYQVFDEGVGFVDVILSKVVDDQIESEIKVSKVEVAKMLN